MEYEPCSHLRFYPRRPSASQGDANLASNLDNTGDVNNGTYINKTYNILDSTGAVVSAVSLPLFFQRQDPRTGAIPFSNSTANSMYNGVTVTLRKPMSHGVEILANYTLSKATDNGEGFLTGSGGEGQIGESPLNPLNLNFEQGPSGIDSRNRFTASAVYAPTFAKKFTNKLAKEALDGWAISTIFTAQNGTHYEGTVSGSSRQKVTINGVTYTGVDGGMTGVVGSTGNPGSGRIGFVQRNFYELPNLFNDDIRLTKQFSIKERYHIEIRGEAFNVANSTLVLAVTPTAYGYAAPGSSGCPTAPNTNTCMVPRSTFQQPSTTSGTGGLLGARQLQAGIRFDF